MTTASVDSPQHRAVFDYRYDAIATKVKEDQFSTIIFGDSIVQRWPTSLFRSALGKKTLDAGIDGQFTQSENFLIHTTDWASQRPGQVFLLIGTNNLHASDACAVVAGIISNVKAIHAAFPGTNVGVISVLPRGPDMSEFDAEIKAINRALKEKSSPGEYVFIDVHDAFLCARHTPCDLMTLPNWVHPSRKGYELLSQYVRGKL